MDTEPHWARTIAEISLFDPTTQDVWGVFHVKGAATGAIVEIAGVEHTGYLFESEDDGQQYFTEGPGEALFQVNAAAEKFRELIGIEVEDLWASLTEPKE